MTQPVKFKGDKVDLDLSPLGTTFKKARVFVMNKKTGNVAILEYTASKDQKVAKPIEVKEDAFTYVRTVKLKVVAEDGAPVESALVEITDGEGTPMSAIVTPSDTGVASFENVAAGEINVKVRTKGATRTIDSDIELPIKRKIPWFEKDIRVKGDVDTLQVLSQGNKAPAELGREGESSAGPRGDGLNSVLQTVAGLIFLILVITIIYAVLKSKGITTEQALRKMGVKLPGEGEASTEPGLEEASLPQVDPSLCPFCGQRRDASGNCACTIPSGSVSQTSVPTPGVPRLVGVAGTYMGQVFEIGSGSKTIGREAQCDIALIKDSTTSRRHATITASAGDYSIRDEGSSNGTFVNGARVTEQKLVPGDEIQIGGTRFRFEV
ncbi:MAG: FHA domain-containing protein [Armatimonadetes bacterium]|nr:FHA domain-containing protein [Armatimonadota bacterium]